jgi:NAD(P)-dependent dehydrogenase (short-subunit alcohol dehydrogenase family)
VSGEGFRLAGRVALVTGAARGLGAAIAEALIAAGAKVMLSDVLDTEGKATAQRLSPDGREAAFRVHNVTDEQAWQQTVAATVEQFGALDILVNNAGIETAALITQCTVEDFRQLMEVNVTGVFLGMKHAIPVIKPGGAIINLSSVAGMIGTTGHIAYHASKGAVRSMTKAAAIECAQLGTGIRVNSLHPGIVQTDMGTNFIQHFVDLQLAPDYATAEAGIKALHPMGFGEVSDIASAVIYLASDAARWVNGSELVIDGGLLAA